jgi:hypothetical protein
MWFAKDPGQPTRFPALTRVQPRALRGGPVLSTAMLRLGSTEKLTREGKQDGHEVGMQGIIL